MHRYGGWRAARAAAFLFAGGAVLSCPVQMSSPAQSQATKARTHLLTTPRADGQVRALVVGIDRYQAAPHLEGAVADALDIAGTLRRRGVTDLTLLTENQASRAALIAALDGLASRTGPADVVIVTFAGHGAQEDITPSAEEPDGKDEFFLLWGFAKSGPGTAERIVDNEVHHWLRRIAGKGAQTIFLADACFGGGLAKAADPRAGRFAIRGLKRVERPELETDDAYYIKPGEDRLPRLASIPAADDATRTLPTLTFLAAVDDQHTAPEVSIAGEATPRGAASYVFARALEGQADADRNGITTRGELISMIRNNVRAISQNRQTPVAEPRTLDTAKVELFATVSDGEPVANETKPAAKAAPLLATLSAGQMPPGNQASKPANTAARPDVFWDQRTGDVISAIGDVLAYGIARANLGSVLDRITALQGLTALAARRSFDMTISPADRIFPSGERFTATLDGIYGRHLILLNLAGDGTVQFLFPTGNADPLIERNTLDVPLRAGPPFGTDTLIAVVTARRHAALELDLKLLDKHRQPKAILAAIAARLEPADRVGLATYSTRR